MGHPVGIIDKQGNMIAVSDYSEICKAAAENYANEKAKYERYTVMHILGEDRYGVLTDIDPLHQAFLVIVEGKGIVSSYVRQRESVWTEWGEWKGKINR